MSVKILIHPGEVILEHLEQKQELVKAELILTLYALTAALAFIRLLDFVLTVCICTGTKALRYTEWRKCTIFLSEL